MLHKLKNRKQEGFTIIEVLIVLAIAGLILLIVFLAVPALQRNSRNTQRKNDAAGVLGAVSEYSTNNAGATAKFASWSAPTLTLCNASGCTGTDAQSQSKLGYYTATATSPTVGNVTVYGTYTAPPAVAIDALIIEEGATCTSATTAAAGSSRAVAAIYGIEASGKFIWQCSGS